MATAGEGYREVHWRGKYGRGQSMGLLSVALVQQSALESAGWFGVFSLTDLLKFCVHYVCAHDREM